MAASLQWASSATSSARNRKLVASIVLGSSTRRYIHPKSVSARSELSPLSTKNRPASSMEDQNFVQKQEPGDSATRMSKNLMVSALRGLDATHGEAILGPFRLSN